MDSMDGMVLSQIQRSTNQTDLVAPEFQILDTPRIARFVNAMAAMIQEQGLSSCNGGFGIDAFRCDGSLQHMEYSGSAEDIWSEMDLLLTGGRLGPYKQQLMDTAGWGRSSQEFAQAAQHAIVLTPQFHTLGNVTPIGSRIPTPPQTSQDDVSDYKAHVTLFLFGGADTFNMLVPMECELFDQYMDIRGSVAMTPDELLEINTTGQSCSKFGIHSRLPILKELYDLKEAAFVTNVGSLIVPGVGCPGNFGHSGMQHATQTMVCQHGFDISHGGGGRMADALLHGPTSGLVTSFSLSGNTPWSQGVETKHRVVSGSGVSAHDRPDHIKRVIKDLTTIEFSTAYAKEYVRQFGDALGYDKVEEVLQRGDALLELPEADYGGIQELKQVARLIGGRQARKAGRDIFFVGLGGFDHHADLAPHLASKFRTMEIAIRAFVTEMKAQEVWNRVVLSTQSEFGRALLPSGNQGSNHGWAGTHFVLSGAIHGGRVLNDFPKLVENRPVPQFPFESYLAPIAEWFGVQPSQLHEVFPNLPNFNSSSHVISDLF